MLLTAGSLQAASFSARVDRHSLQAGDSLLLTLELDQPDYFVDPDISPLHQDFTLLSSSHQPLVEQNGQAVSLWQLRLQPKREGRLTLPALQLGNLSSTPLDIDVLPRSPGQPGQLGPVHIDASLDTEQLYVQAQAILTLRVFHSVPLYSDGQFSPLTIAGARVHSLGEPVSYQHYIQGVRHGVIETRFAIFPQASGTLTIPALTFTATLAANEDTGAQSGAPGRTVQVKSAHIPLKVLPPPDAFPPNATWLPAQNLQLSHSISPDQPDTTMEQAIRYSLTLQAEGLPATLLPHLLPDQLAGARLYANPVSQSERMDAQGLHSEQYEERLLVPTRAGTLELPAHELPWWNTRTNQLEWARVDARSLHILEPQQSTAPALAQRPATELLLWQLACLLLTLLSLGLVFLWRRARKLPAIVPVTPARTSARLLENLKKACLGNQPQQARTALDQWIRHNQYSLASLARSSPELQDAQRALNQALYTPDDHPWDGKPLWNAVSAWVQQQQQDANPQLPPLYPP
ncbi:MAG: protein BatD [Thiopseudomonas sp.]|nr:protein BatD [Thiopseudomonas sp.]